MSKKKLTNYDLFILKKQEEQQMNQHDSENPAYADYLVRELKRTTPSDRKVMTEEEFNRSENVTRPIARATSNVAKKGEAFKKLGLLFLVFYVIIVLALALIVMVHAGNSDVIPGAAASDATGGIQTMPLEDEQVDTGDWFDAICDALNK